ncbi:MAG: four helix bundle protein [Cyclobacteriaceae bacterium]|nr:four helix bundle protein [Cyclobacteriaceae bacterium]
MFDFQKLNVYQKAKHFHGFCIGLIESKHFSRFTNDQLGRASFSIVLNIAEGSGRFSKADRRNFFVIARSSVFECVAALDVLKDQKLISVDEYQGAEKLADELSRILYSMIQNLKTK